MVSHRNLVHSTRARTAHYGPTPPVYLLLSSISFDSSVAGLFWSLCEGGCLVLPEEETTPELHALTALIARERVTHLLTVPSAELFSEGALTPASSASLPPSRRSHKVARHRARAPTTARRGGAA